MLPAVFAVFLGAVGERKPQLLDSFIRGAKRFDAMASEIVSCLSHVSAGIFQRVDSFGDARMTQTLRLRRNRHYTGAEQYSKNDPREKLHRF
jgi:macrodomain Ter protein organizer (MatP/YcbG family)